MPLSETVKSTETSGRNLIWPVVILAAQIPLLIAHGEFLWSRPHYRFFPILLVAIAVLGWLRWPRVFQPLSRSWNRTAWWLLLAGLVVLAAATLAASANIAAFAFVLTSGGVVLLAGGRHATRTALPVWLLTWLLVVPPMGLDTRLITRLQEFTSTSTSAILELLGIGHLMTGNVLHLPGKTFLVEEACSGVQSLFALLAATAIYLVWQPRSWINGLLLLLSVIGWALFANVLRVFAIAFAYDQSGADLSSGWQHETLGYGTFVVALLMIVSTDQLFTFFLSPIKEMSPIESEQSPFSRFWNRLFERPQINAVTDSAVPAAADSSRNSRRLGGAAIWCSAIVVVLLGLVQVVNWRFSQSALEDYHRRAAQAAAEINQQTLPDEMGVWRRVGFQVEQRERSSILGENSKAWTYQTAQGPVVFSCDYPFFGWHELADCYRGQGWQMQRLAAHTKREDSGSTGEFREYELTRAGEHAYLIYALFDTAGGDVLPPDGLFRYASFYLQGGLRGGPLELLVPMGASTLDTTTYQTQVFVTANKPISLEERAEVRQKFQEFRETLKQHWRDYALGPSKK